MKIAMFDQACLENEINAYKERLERCECLEVIPYTNNLSQYQNIGVCLYIVPISSGGKADQFDIVRNNPKVRRWIILLIGDNMTAHWAVENHWQGGLHGLRRPYEIQSCLSEEILGNIIDTISAIDDSGKARWLFISNKHDVGKSCIRDLLLEKGVGGEFTLVDHPVLSDLDSVIKKANLIFIVGSSPRDFTILPLKDVENRLYLIFNKADKSVGEYLQINDMKLRIIQNMNANGWNLNENFSNFIATSAMYESYKLEMDNGSIDTTTLMNNTEFVMWDKYGLPMPRTAYNNHHSIMEFLGGFSQITGCLADKMREIVIELIDDDLSEEPNQKAGN